MALIQGGDAPEAISGALEVTIEAPLVISMRLFTEPGTTSLILPKPAAEVSHADSYEVCNAEFQCSLPVEALAPDLIYYFQMPSCIRLQKAIRRFLSADMRAREQKIFLQEGEVAREQLVLPTDETLLLSVDLRVTAPTEVILLLFSRLKGKKAYIRAYFKATRKM